MAALEKMPGHPRLHRRGTTYYHRAAVPTDIAGTYPKSEETFSLKTKDYAEAVRRVRVAAAEIDAKFEAHRRWAKTQGGAPLAELSPEQLRRIREAYYQFRLEEDEETRLKGFEVTDDTGRLVSEMQDDPRPTFIEFVEAEKWATSETKASYARGEQDSFFRSEAEEVLSWDGIEINLSKGSPSWPQLIRALQEAAIEAAEAIQMRNRGEIVRTPERPAVEPFSAPVGQPLSMLFEERTTEARTTDRWSPKLIDDYSTWTALFIEIAGDKPILDYVKQDARDFKAVLMALPSNRQKRSETRGRPARECAEIAERLDLPRLNVDTINKALSRLQATWKWANRQLDEDVTDIFGPMKLEAKARARDQRDPFTPVQLVQIFHSPLFLGCLSERRRSEPGNTDMSHTPWFWLPLLGLFSGARLNELCQLRTYDVREEHGIPFLSIDEAEETQRVKSGAGREVPIHPSLVKLGFCDYVDAMRKEASGRVFPTLKLDKKGYYSDRASKDFARFLEQVGAKTPKTSFHSLRHNFKDACRNCGVPRDVADILQGHSLGGMAGRYGSGRIPVKTLAAEVSKIEFPELDLSEARRFGV